MLHELQLPWDGAACASLCRTFSYWLGSFGSWCRPLLPLLGFYGCLATSTSIWLHTICHWSVCGCVYTFVGASPQCWRQLDLNCIAHLTVVSFPSADMWVYTWRNKGVEDFKKIFLLGSKTFKHFFRLFDNTSYYDNG